MSIGSVTVFGSINQDITLNLQRFPESGQTVIATGSLHSIGGKGANQAMAAALSGAATAMVGAVGRDSGGAQALDALRGAGVSVESVQRYEDAPTGTAYICVQSDGENTIVVDPGANHLLRADVFPSTPSAQGQWCLLSVEVPEAEVLAVAQRAKEQGYQVGLNASPRLTKTWRPELFDLLIVNEVEIEPLAGPEWVASENLAELLGIQAVLVTQGSAGVRVDLAGRRSVHLEAVPVTLRDSTGCGDAFAGVLLGQLAAGADWVAAVEAAVVFAGCVAEHPGASDSYPKAFAAAREKLGP